jgi:predicted O-methyltransferase YrrM
MGARRQRIGAVVQSALLHGETTWSTEFLAARDPRFSEAWDVARLIPGWFEEVNAAAQFLVLAEVRPRSIVEIGSYLGKSTVFYAKALDVLGIEGTVTAIDPHTGGRQHLEALGVSELPTFDMFRSHLLAAGVRDKVHPVVATSHEAAEGWTEPIDFLFIDGWHSYEAVLQDGQDWIPHLSDGGIVVFDDATKHSGLTRAINELDAGGIMTLYGTAFGQAYAGRRPPVPPSVRTVLKADRPLTRHLPAKTSSATWTRYVVTTPTKATEPLGKRQAILKMVHAVHAAGATAAMIETVLTKNKFLGVDGSVEGDRLVEAFVDAYPAFDTGQWFFREPVHDDGRTWVVSNLWGTDTRATLAALVAIVPDAGVSYSQI